MKTEAPILFKPEMIQAYLRGDKTQTRRIEKKQPAPWATFDHFDPLGQAVFSDGTVWPARYGQPAGFVNNWPGTVLWVKENFRHGTCPNDTSMGIALFDYGQPGMVVSPGTPDKELAYCRNFKKKSAIHMWRWASRVQMRLITLRIERLQAITEEDAKAEGVSMPDYPAEPFGDIYRKMFIELWDRVNLDRGFGWATNPFVSVLGLGHLEEENG